MAGSDLAHFARRQHAVAVVRHTGINAYRDSVGRNPQLNRGLDPNINREELSHLDGLFAFQANPPTLAVGKEGFIGQSCVGRGRSDGQVTT